MEKYEDTDNSLPFIDDSLTDEEIKPDNYNLRIIENYQNKNRNIEITNESPDDIMGQSLSPVAPLAEETETSDRLSDSPVEEKCRHLRKSSVKKTGMKLVVKGWNSTISIQGLDNKSSITFRRKNERIKHEKVIRSIQRKEKETEEERSDSKVIERPRKGRWKLLTKSLISKSRKFERKGLDERYPKYVLLKNEEEITSEKESYPKMVVFNEGKKQKENFENKSEFNFKRSFKNKTKPIEEKQTMKEDYKKVISQKQKLPLTARSQSENRNVMYRKRIVVERRKSFTGTPKVPARSAEEISFGKNTPPQTQVFKEIKDIFEDTLKLCADSKQADEGTRQVQPESCYPSVPSHFCQFSCHDPGCFASLHDQPPMYVPVYAPFSKPKHLYKHSNTQTNEEEMAVLNSGPAQNTAEPELSYQTLPFSLLSSFFPRVVIMKTFGEGSGTAEPEVKEQSTKELLATKKDEGKLNEEKQQQTPNKNKTPSNLDVPEKDLALKSKMILDDSNFEPEVDPIFTGDIYVNCLALNGMCSSDDDQKAKTDDSEATEYLHYCESDISGNESTKPTFTWENPAEEDSAKTADNKSTERIEEVEDNAKNYTLTKIGYKMYDNLTKLSLKREAEDTEKTEVSGCDCGGTGNKKSPCNITLESNNRVVKVTVPENELNLKFVNSDTSDLQIGVSSTGKEQQKEKKVVNKSELWHADNGHRELVVSKRNKTPDGTKGSPKISVSFGDSRDIILSFEMNEKEQKEEKIKEKLTKEVKVGTDDIDLAGGHFSCSLGGNYKNLSPRTGQLLKNLQEKLEIGEKERKFLEEKINERLTDQKFKTGILPGIFLVKQISPRPGITQKKPLPPSNVKKMEKVTNIREYYCEECLATMRIFEDENPSVKSMVDKFETIIQLESY